MNGVVESGSCTPPALELSLEVIAARARPSGLSSLHPWTSQSNLLCYHPSRMLALRLDGRSVRSLSHARTDPESMLQLTLGRPVLRTTFAKRDSSESCLICPADIRLSIHPQVCRKDPETQNRNITLLRTRNLLGCSLTTMRSSWGVECCIIFLRLIICWPHSRALRFL